MVSLIHFEEKLHHAQHYLGFVQSDLSQRLAQHLSGRGAKLLKACNENGIRWHLARVWPQADRHFERKLKNRKKSRLLCPGCGWAL